MIVDPAHLEITANRARELMDKEHVDALVATTCENFYYLSGHPSTFMYALRMSETALVMLFRDSGRRVIIMNDFEASGVSEELLARSELRTYPTWVDVDDPYGLRGGRYEGKRPTTNPVEEMWNVFAEVLSEEGLADGGRVAIERGAMKSGAFEALGQRLPQHEWKEAAPLFADLRKIKTSWEIAQLRKSCAAAEAGLSKAASRILEGSTAAGIGLDYCRALLDNEEGTQSRFHMISVGPHFAPAHILDTTPAKPGDVIKFDVGADVNGYGSDIARTFVLGSPSDTVRTIYEALRAGHDRLLEIIRPGLPMQEAFHDAMGVIRRNGLPGYNRGHLGHSSGLTLAAEEPPFIGPSEATVFQPGMVVCIETPYYGYGIGSIMIEDMLVITDEGCERLNTLSRDLIAL